MYSLIRIRYFISVAAWLIPAIIHFLCGSQLQVLKCVSISISCLLLSDINTCFWLSLEMFYFGFNACSSQVIFYSGTKGQGRGGGWWAVPGLLMAPRKSKPTSRLPDALLGVRDYFHMLLRTAAGQQRLTVRGEGAPWSRVTSQGAGFWLQKISFSSPLIFPLEQLPTPLLFQTPKCSGVS